MLSSVGRGDGEARGGVCVLILNGGFGRDIFLRPYAIPPQAIINKTKPCMCLFEIQ